MNWNKKIYCHEINHEDPLFDFPFEILIDNPTFNFSSPHWHWIFTLHSICWNVMQVHDCERKKKYQKEQKISNSIHIVRLSRKRRYSFVGSNAYTFLSSRADDDIIQSKKRIFFYLPYFCLSLFLCAHSDLNFWSKITEQYC